MNLYLSSLLALSKNKRYLFTLILNWTFISRIRTSLGTNHTCQRAKCFYHICSSIFSYFIRFARISGKKCERNRSIFFRLALFFINPILFQYYRVSNIRLIQEGKPGHFADPEHGQPIVYPIHHLMSLLLLLKTLAIFFEAVRYHYLRVTGHAVLWSAVYYTFAFLKGTTLFTVILLLGSGWSFVKPFLSDREKKMILAILVLQVLNNIAIVVLTQETEGEIRFDNWTAVLHLVDILCCCAVLIPIVWHVNALEKNIEQSDQGHTDINIDSDAIISELEFEDEYQERPSNKRLVEKLKLFRRFYLLVVAYIYMTRIVVYLFATMLTYRHQWLRYFVVEGVTLAFYFTVGSQFKPMSENPYLSVHSQGSSRRQTEIELTT